MVINEVLFWKLFIFLSWRGISKWRDGHWQYLLRMVLLYFLQLSILMYLDYTCYHYQRGNKNILPLPSSKTYSFPIKRTPNGWESSGNMLIIWILQSHTHLFLVRLTCFSPPRSYSKNNANKTVCVVTKRSLHKPRI